MAKQDLIAKINNRRLGDRIQSSTRTP